MNNAVNTRSTQDGSAQTTADGCPPVQDSISESKLMAEDQRER